MHGAEQLLLDAHSLKTFMLNLPSVGSSLRTKPPAAYTRLVQTTMNKVEMVLKVSVFPAFFVPIVSQMTQKSVFGKFFAFFEFTRELSGRQRIMNVSHKMIYA